jgi:peptidoglycan hydrolase-like protein with peptidoglycan-binding domain
MRAASQERRGQQRSNVDLRFNGLPPDQVIANVQGALQQLGYYQHAVDGVLGPMRRNALANYQRDHNLAITGAIDPQTLTSLGFIA